MKDKKGMTLIEVILALFLLGVISIAFLPSIWSSYKMMGKAKDITEELYVAQQNMEQAMEIARHEINEYNEDKSKENPMTRSVTAFDKEVKGIDIKESLSKDDRHNRGYIYTFIADTPIIKENLPEVEQVKFLNEESLIYWGNNSLTGSHKIEDTSNYFMSLKRWYVSKPGFDGYIPNTISNESYWGRRYPSWPNDYELINNNKDKLTNLRDYIGRYIVYSVIPVSKSGRYGIEVASTPVYIMGPPKLDNLTFHLDPYTLRDRYGKFIEDGEVINWKDFSPNVNMEFIFNHGGTNKINLGYEIDDGKALRLNGSKASIYHFPNAYNYYYDPTSNNEFTIFLVYKNTSSNDSKSQNIIDRVGNYYHDGYNYYNRGWKLKLSKGKLEFQVGDRNHSKSLVQSTTTGNDKFIISCIVSNSNIKMILDKEENKEVLEAQYSTNIQDYNVIMTLGDNLSEENIYELIIYSSALSDNEVNDTRKYLSEKHNIRLKNQD